MKKSNKVRTIVTVGMLGALAAILMWIEIPVFFVPGFMRLDVSNIPTIFAGFFFGPVAGVIVALIKDLIHVIASTNPTAGVGELMDFVASSICVLCASLIYRKMHTKKGAIISLVVSTLVVSFASLVLNYYIFYPMYLGIYGMSMNDLVTMAQQVNPAVNNIFTLLVFSILPFNLLKYVLISFITYLVYKKSSITLRKFVGKK